MHADRLPERDLVLLGAGHTHAQILRMWLSAPREAVRLTCVSPFSTATYSGMLPGVLAGQYAPEEIELDLVRLCALAGVRLIIDSPVRIDVPGRRLLFAQRPPISFDLLSVGIGSRPKEPPAPLPAWVVRLKPMQTLLPRLTRAVAAAAAASPGDAPLRAAIVGGGAAGVEVACCLPGWLERTTPGRRWRQLLVESGPALARGVGPGLRRRIEQALESRQIEVQCGRRVIAIHDLGLEYADGATQPADLVIWAAGAEAVPLLREAGLECDERGFLLTDATLRVVSRAPVFAVGDAGTIVGNPSAKAGVYAVRQGPVLWDNLLRWLDGRPLRAFRPQTSFLKLINLGDGRAFGEWRGFSFAGRWVWRWKDRVDRGFMQQFDPARLALAAPRGRTSPGEATTERDERASRMCRRDRGGQIGADVLHRVLQRVHSQLPAAGPAAPVGLADFDDVAAPESPSSESLALTIDRLGAPFDDPWLLGRVAALHALNDLWAKGGRKLSALALATLPEGPPAQQERLLESLLAGAVRELSAAEVPLVFGYTREGPRLELGLSLSAGGPRDARRLMSRARVGDELWLTKPLGVGVLLAAHAEARLAARCWDALLASLLYSNAPYARAADELGLLSATDVSGFGLGGAVLELLEASGLSARLEISRLPRLPGAEELWREGLQSTLARANRERQQPAWRGPAGERAAEAEHLLCDPQTSGGLLLCAPPGAHARMVEHCEALGVPVPWSIGRLIAREGAMPEMMGDT